MLDGSWLLVVDLLPAGSATALSPAEAYAKLEGAAGAHTLSVLFYTSCFPPTLPKPTWSHVVSFLTLALLC